MPPPTEGARLPTLDGVLTNRSTRWKRLILTGWYSGGERIVEVCSDTAVWRHRGMPVVPIR